VGAQRADLVFTDPPYNVDYEGYTEEKLKIRGNKMTPEQFQQFLASVFSSFLWALKQGGSMYVCHPSSWQREFQEPSSCRTSKRGVRSSGEEHLWLGFRALQVSAQADLLLPLQRAERSLVRR
jgi:hypothetical protein